ncbi:hypothetical protein IJJ27_04335 [bacterium]|nr:hypothetical protein [bacterium]
MVEKKLGVNQRIWQTIQVQKGKKLHQGQFTVSFACKKYRRILYLKRDDSLEHQQRQIAITLRNFVRDINLPSIISEYNLDED